MDRSRSVAFESSSEDDVEEVSAENSQGDTAFGFCIKQYNCRILLQFGDWILYMNGVVWYREKYVGVKGSKTSFIGSDHRDELTYRMHSLYVSIRSFYAYPKLN
jgi:hypothetical protein